MANPTNTTRQSPGPNYIMLHEGYRALITFARNPRVRFEEKSLKPMGRGIGEPIDTRTQHRDRYVTKRPPSLIELKPLTVTAGYDPAVAEDIDELLGQEGAITYQYPDGTDEDFWGYLQDWDPAELSDGTLPECTLTIIPTAWDPNNNVEAGPVMADVTGT